MLQEKGSWRDGPMFCGTMTCWPQAGVLWVVEQRCRMSASFAKVGHSPMYWVYSLHPTTLTHLKLNYFYSIRKTQIYLNAEAIWRVNLQCDSPNACGKRTRHLNHFCIISFNSGGLPPLPNPTALYACLFQWKLVENSCPLLLHCHGL